MEKHNNERTKEKEIWVRFTAFCLQIEIFTSFRQPLRHPEHDKAAVFLRQQYEKGNMSTSRAPSPLLFSSSLLDSQLANSTLRALVLRQHNSLSNKKCVNRELVLVAGLVLTTRTNYAI